MMRGQSNQSPAFAPNSKHFGRHIGNNGPFYDHGQASGLHRMTIRIGLALGLAAAAQAGCTNDQPGDTAVATAEPTSFLPAADEAAGDCIDGGLLETTLYGALEGAVDWDDDEMICEGMPRPAGAGVRLRFAGRVGDSSIAFIIAIPGLDDKAAAELASNVTLIEEGNGRFFSTPGLDTCWTDVTGLEAIDDTAGHWRYRVVGTLYCIAPLVEVNGEASVSIPELRFSGIIDHGSS